MRRHARREAQEREREQNAESTTARGEHQRFGQQLPRQAHPASSERGTDGEFATASGAPRKQQGGNIDADDQKNGADPSGSDEERDSDASGHLVECGSRPDERWPTITKREASGERLRIDSPHNGGSLEAGLLGRGQRF